MISQCALVGKETFKEKIHLNMARSQGCRSYKNISNPLIRDIEFVRDVDMKNMK